MVVDLFGNPPDDRLHGFRFVERRHEQDHGLFLILDPSGSPGVGLFDAEPSEHSRSWKEGSDGAK